MSAKWYLIIILAASIIVHFAFFGHPAETVFDEVHFGKFISAYYTGEYYFDIHPPLGKLIIAGFAKIFDFQPQYNFSDIGKKFPDNKYLALRFLPTVAGTLLPIVVYLLILELGISRIAALTGTLLVIFDNALLTQSRLILLDPFLLLFGFASLLFYFKYRRKLTTYYLLLTTIFAGLTISIKWTGLSFIALPMIIESFEKLKELRQSDKTANKPAGIKQAIVNFIPVLIRLIKISSFFLISLAIYFSVFVLHFTLLPKSGPGDAFMSLSFRKTLIGSNYQNDPNIKPASFFLKFIELNKEMYRSNQRLGATHPYGSRWYTWPLMVRPIYYWVDSTPSTSTSAMRASSEPQPNSSVPNGSGQVSRIYFFGNPVVWWLSTVAILYGLGTMANGLWLKFIKLKPLSIVSGPLAVLLVGYFLNILPFIGVRRVMFLYHYLTALIFAIITLCYLIDKNALESLEIRKNSRKVFAGIIIIAAVLFIFFAPLNYGLPLSDKAYETRVWFASWK